MGNRCVGAHTDEFVLVLPTGSAELVRESSGSTYYRPKVEEAWIRAEKRVAENQWRVVDRSGRVYTFGDVESARVATSTPATFMSQSGTTCDFTAVWALTHVEDPNGNAIDIAWSKIFNTLYPATIRWGANSHAGVPTCTWRACCLNGGHRSIAPHQPSPRHRDAPGLARIYAIDTSSRRWAPGLAVRSYVLDYDDPASYQSLLAAVSATGRPTQHFLYSPGVGSQQADAAIARPPGSDRAPARREREPRGVADGARMNGDGLPTSCAATMRSRRRRAVYWARSTPAGSSVSEHARRPAGPGNRTHLRNVVVTDASCNANGWSCTQADTFDITGDGIPDHVDASNLDTWVVHPGGGPQWGFGGPINWPAPHRRYLRRSKDGTTYQDLVDMNADGLPDLVVSGTPGQQSPFNWLVYLNTGAGFEAQPLSAWPAPVGTIGEHVSNGTGQALVDFNGDGLPDIVRSGYPGAGAWTDPRCQQSATAYASCLEVYFNTGQGFGAMEPPIPVPQGFGVQELGENGNVVQDIFDVNGDGLPDWIYRRFNAITLGYDPEWRVLLNVGGTLEPVTYAPQTFLPAPYTEAIPARVWSGGNGFFGAARTRHDHRHGGWNGDGMPITSHRRGRLDSRRSHHRPAPEPPRRVGERPRRHQYRRLPAVHRVQQHRRRREARPAVHPVGGGSHPAERRSVHAAHRKRSILALLESLH